MRLFLCALAMTISCVTLLASTGQAQDTGGFEYSLRLGYTRHLSDAEQAWRMDKAKEAGARIDPPGLLPPSPGTGRADERRDDGPGRHQNRRGVEGRIVGAEQVCRARQEHRRAETRGGRGAEHARVDGT